MCQTLETMFELNMACAELRKIADPLSGNMDQFVVYAVSLD